PLSVTHSFPTRRSSDLSVLTEDGRKEIVDYVLGLGFDPDSHLKIKRVSSFTDPSIFGTTQVIAGPRAEDPGWRGKIAMGVYEDKDRKSTRLNSSHVSIS